VGWLIYRNPERMGADRDRRRCRRAALVIAGVAGLAVDIATVSVPVVTYTVPTAGSAASAPGSGSVTAGGGCLACAI